MVVIGATGSGKTWLERELLNLHPKWSWTVLDGKRGLDPSLQLGDAWKDVRRWEGPFQRTSEVGEFIRSLWSGAEPEPARLKLIGPKMKSDADFAKLRPEFIRALQYARWHQRRRRPMNVAIDEMQIIAAPDREGGLGLGNAWVAPLLREIRYTGASVLTATQHPTWIPRSAVRETTHRFLFRPADEDTADVIGRVGGNRKAIIPVLEDLPEHAFLYVDARRRRYVISKVA